VVRIVLPHGLSSVESIQPKIINDAQNAEQPHETLALWILDIENKRRFFREA